MVILCVNSNFFQIPILAIRSDILMYVAQGFDFTVFRPACMDRTNVPYVIFISIIQLKMAAKGGKILLDISIEYATPFYK
jgi:hypothetical protein